MGQIATIGFFDGVHKGHRYLFKQLNEEAAARGLKPLIVTFEEHPRTVLQSDYIPKLLSTKEERKALLNAYGEVVMLRFSTIRDLTAEQFMIRLKEEYGVEVLLMGYDHRFGSDGLCNPEDYCRVGSKQGIEVLRMEEYQDGTQHVSSTEIRTALEKGDVERAKELLGRPYALFGKVVHGKGLGRTIGFPTANIEPEEPNKIIPMAGVYLVRVIGEWSLVNGERLKDEGVNELANERVSGLGVRGMCNIDSQGVIEVHLLGYKGNLYGQNLTIQFMQFIRKERQFHSLDELQQQIKADVDSSLHPG
ncbi:MAG: riboflavin biosynthesis protein RibF [Bacteroidales bacterium]|nr:riboflavin biosynthesis protein RibF [Bacteroidales bacterium]